MEENNKENIISKIMKLIELGNSENNNNPHEREAASKKAAKLMAEYSISFLDLKVGKNGEENFTTITINGSSTKFVDYEGVLADIIAKTFDCTTINRNCTVDGWHMFFIGDKHDLEIVIYFFKFLRRTLSAMSYRSVTKETLIKSNPWNSPISDSFLRESRRNYCMGIVDTISVRLKDLYTKREEFIPSNCKSLMVIKKDGLEKYIKDKYPNLRTQPLKAFTGDRDAYHKGKKDGNKINLSQPIANKNADTTARLA